MFKNRSIFKKMATLGCLQLSFLLMHPIEADWQPFETLSDPGEQVSAFEGPFLSVNPSGQAVVVWDNPGLSTDVFARVFSPSAGWSPKQTISSDALNIYDKRLYTDQGDCQVFLNADGYAVAVWE